MIVSMDSEPIIPTTEKKKTIFLYRSSISPRFYTQHNYTLFVPIILESYIASL